MTRECIKGLAAFAAESGASGLADIWADLTAKPKPKAPRKAAKSPDARHASVLMTKFYKQKKMRSGEAAEALVDYALERKKGLPEPRPADIKGVAGALKWLGTQMGDFSALKLIEDFVAEHS